MKKIILILFAAYMFLPSLTHAATFQSGDKMYLDTVVSDDLYIAGEAVNILTNINGDLFSAAGQVILDGTVSQDSTILAGDTVIKGEISDDLRIASGTINLSAIVKGDVLAATGNLVMDSDAFIGGDLIAATSEALVGGNINGDVRLIGKRDGSLHLNGVIGGSMTIVGFEHITFGPNAKILGDLWYRSEEAIEIPNGIVNGETVFKQKLATSNIQRSMPAIMAGFSLFRFLSVLFFGLFFIWLFRYFIFHSANIAYESTLKSLGIGFLVVILIPIIILILLITTIGIPMSLVILMMWLIFLYLGKIMAAMLIGFKIIKVDQKSKFGRILGSFALGAFIYTLIGMIPIVGWMINFIFILIALGGMTSHKIEVSEHLKKKKLC